MAVCLPSPTGVVFSSSKLPVGMAEGTRSNDSSRAPSIRDAEKAESTFGDDEKALADYIVPALEKGRKNALRKKPSPWIRLQIWYNPYRMVCCSAASIRPGLTVVLIDVHGLVCLKHDRHRSGLHSLLGLCRESCGCARPR